MDVRYLQIVIMAALLSAGALFRDFSIEPWQVLWCFFSGLATQWFFLRVYLPRLFPNQEIKQVGYLSAVITCIGISLLLRSGSWWAHPLAASLAISCKFLLRYRGKHIFNPANLGVVLAISLFPQCWVSAGQWGSDIAVLVWLTAFGTLVATNAKMQSTSWAFLGFYLGIWFAHRVLYLGYEVAVWMHQMQSGALLLFAFFMISDPKTSPNHLGAKIFHALFVASLAYIWQYYFFYTNGLLWALLLSAPAVLVLDKLFTAQTYQWHTNGENPMSQLIQTLSIQRKAKTALLALCLLGAGLFLPLADAHAFCGFYVGKADASLYNKASKVVLVRHDGKTVISMMNDYQGPLTEFALVVPVPEILEKGQVNVGDRALFDRIDAFSAPRLVEYFDDDPCNVRRMMMEMSAAGIGNASAPQTASSKMLGVKVEAEYTVGEYDIVILSAKESNGLETWLTQNNYNIPAGANQALEPYIKQGLKFFVAKVNVKEQLKSGLNYLRPLQFAFSSEKFMLPIRLGLLNANGPQELFIYALTKTGRVETTNYRTIKIPTDVSIPVYVKDEFADFYRAMFDSQVKQNDMRGVFTEYVWNMGWCDPCAADPLSPEELKKLGVFWLNTDNQRPGQSGMSPPWPGGGAVPVMITRLHLRYTKDTFPEDLMFQETADSDNFQGRYILNHPWSGKESGKESSCSEAKTYAAGLPKRFEQEAKQLANLTGWEINKIRAKMKLTSNDPKADDPKDPNGEKNHGEKKWWNDIW